MWRDPNARRVLIARFVSRTGGWAGFFVGVWGKAAYDLHATPGELAALMALVGVAAVVGSALAGVLIDRADPKRVLVAGEALFVPAILAVVPADSMLQMMLLTPAAWLAGALVMTAVAAFPPYLSTDAAAVTRLNAALEAASTLGFVVGPGLGALMVRLWSIDSVFVGDAATSLVAVALVAGVDLRPAPPQAPRRGLDQLRGGFRYAYSSRPIRLVLLLATITFLSFGAFTALEPFFYRDVLHTGPEALGWVNALFGVGLMAGTGVLHRNATRLASLRAIVTLTALGGLGAVAYTATTNLAVVAIGAVYWGTVLGVLLPTLRSVLHLHTAEGFVGRVMGAFNVHHEVGEMLPLAAAPGLAALFGVRPVLIGTGVAVAALAPLVAPAAVRLDRQVDEPPVPPPRLPQGLAEPVVPNR